MKNHVTISKNLFAFGTKCDPDMFLWDCWNNYNLNLHKTIIDITNKQECMLCVIMGAWNIFITLKPPQKCKLNNLQKLVGLTNWLLGCWMTSWPSWPIPTRTSASQCPVASFLSGHVGFADSSSSACLALLICPQVHCASKTGHWSLSSHYCSTFA